MDRNQVDNINAGHDLDRLVAVEIMENTVIEDDIFGLMEMHTAPDGANIYYPLRAYSQNLHDAKRVIAKMVQRDYHLEAAYWQTEDRPEVICRAALRAVLKRKKATALLERRACLRVVK
ncbi:conserved hypothetical protein [Desulfosarcina cetonica]|uniref:hypothetical protein n=1 Tax=Desulfosarcina cetonica TaxID=90730 RepID=UPI0006D14080|nr:hypothetical protein [Desulfosarcina cetonica]VTR65960.1 conserved hypothetical protein [Desulfosarcina cetonica]